MAFPFQKRSREELLLLLMSSHLQLLKIPNASQFIRSWPSILLSLASTNVKLKCETLNFTSTFEIIKCLTFRVGRCDDLNDMEKELMSALSVPLPPLIKKKTRRKQVRLLRIIALLPSSYHWQTRTVWNFVALQGNNKSQCKTNYV